MMSQGVLPVQCKFEATRKPVTGRGGLLAYLDLMAKSDLWRMADKYVGGGGDQGWTDGQQVSAMVLLNLSGGSCVDDLLRLEKDGGLSHMVRLAEQHGLSRQERREFERRHRKGRERSFPSPSAVRLYLEKFIHPKQESMREEAREAGVKAFIPEKNEYLQGLSALNAGFVKKVQSWSPSPIATLDMDATLVESHKKEARYCYKKFPGYQPLNVWWAEPQLVLRSEFRDGNVPAGYQQLRVFEETLADLPSSVKKIYLRSDSAGYQWNLLRYCAEAKNQRFGEIKFAVASDVTDSFKQAVSQVSDKDWQPLIRQAKGKSIDTGQEWAEVCFVPNEAAHKKNGPQYRYLAIREALRQLELPGVEAKQGSLPFPVMTFKNQSYKLFGVVTNRSLPGDELIWWLRARCGKSEEAHAVMKSDLAGGILPSGHFGANAAWWQLMILSLNIQSAMKKLVLGDSWINRRMKAVRFGFINVVARFVLHARKMVMILSGNIEAAALIVKARETIQALPRPPPV